MAKRGAIGDIHLSGFESDQLDKDGLPYRLGLIINTLQFITDSLRKMGIREADILGDLINDKSIIYTVAQDAFNEFLKKNNDFFFRIISGNHDMSSTGQLQKSAITVFGSHSNVECIPYDPKVIGGITYVPYTSNFLDVLKGIEPNNVLVSHLGSVSYTHLDVYKRQDDIYEDLYEFNCKYYKVGYDGLSVTIDGNPRNTAVWGEANLSLIHI